MKRLLTTALLISFLGPGLGCAMCANPWDCAYGTYGGKWQRANQFHGRVNSAFDPADGMIAGGETIVEGPGAHEWVQEGSLEPSPEFTGN